MPVPKFKTRVRAVLACQIVNLDRVKFNDAVASGTYPCAPHTISGKSRIFDEEALLPLYFFARLTEFGISAGRAGRLACEMASCAKGRGVEDADRIILLRGSMDEVFIPSIQNYPESTGKPALPYDPDHEKNGRAYQGLGRVLFTVEFYIKHVREIIAERLAYEVSILGEEEE
jgi:hypothetical protein